MEAEVTLQRRTLRLSAALTYITPVSPFSRDAGQAGATALPTEAPSTVTDSSAQVWGATELKSSEAEKSMACFPCQNCVFRLFTSVVLETPRGAVPVATEAISRGAVRLKPLSTLACTVPALSRTSQAFAVGEAARAIRWPTVRSEERRVGKECRSRGSP